MSDKKYAAEEVELGLLVDQDAAKAKVKAESDKDAADRAGQRVKEIDQHPTVAPEFAEISSSVKELRDKKAKGQKLAKSKKLDALKQEVDMDEHKIPLDEFVSRLQTDTQNGLSEEVAKERNAEHGLNQLTPPKRTPWYVTLLKIMFFGFAGVLWFGALMSLIAYFLQVEVRFEDGTEFLALSIVLAGVNILTGLFSFYQNYQSDEVTKKFSALTASVCTVVRGGVTKSMDPKYLTIGDLVEVKNGDKIPADIRIIYSDNMKVDNSSFTGETEPQSRSLEYTNDNPLETKNIAMYTTSCVNGSCKGIVIKIGDNSIIGRIAGLVTGTKKRNAPLSLELEDFIRKITFLALFLAVTIVVIFIAKEGGSADSAIKSIIIFIGILVANVPEGLLATITVALTITQKRMASQNCVVKASECVETLGSTSTICSDKTGTLTQNLMTVAHIWYDNTIFTTKTSVTEASYDDNDTSYEALFDVAALNTTAVFDADQEGVDIQDRKTLGDASESAMLKFCTFSKDVAKHRESFPRVALVPFNSTNKWMLSIHRLPNGDYKIVMKGAPERVLNVCSHFLVKGEKVEINDENTAAWQSAYDELGGMGERVLGAAHLILSKDDYPADFEFDTENFNFPAKGYVFVGLLALIDPPRPAVPTAVAKCRDAGIRVIMVTGDHPITAKAIAKQVGIISLPTRKDIADERNVPLDSVDPSEARAIVLHGTEIKDLNALALREILRNHDEIVFARTSPQQKLIIVEACQNNGWVVAVTGDGVNDSPALKQADIGVAMGISGSDVSIEAADMVLLDDNFATIVVGIEAGRLVFDNLKKSIAYTLTSNIPEISPFIFWVVFDFPLPLGTITILAIDLGTDLWPAISLAYEKAENDIMQRAPRNADVDKLVNSRLISMTYLQIGIIQACAGFMAYFTVYANYGFMPHILPGLRRQWENEANSMLEDSYGQQWNYESRRMLEYHGNSAFFVSIVVVQWADVTICKTRKLSLLDQGMTNWVLNSGILFETLLAVVLCYTPFINITLNIMPLEFVHWLPALPFSLLIFLFDEIRKYYIRKYGDNSFLVKETYY